jgi:DNA modification methylase
MDMKTETPNVLAQEITTDYALYNGDCIDVMKGIPDNSVHYGIWSPPFSSLYTFSDSPRDVSNNSDDRVFWQHYRYVLEGIYRILKPGRFI